MNYDQQQLPRYSGIATFMRCPYQPSLEGVDIGLIGVPFDGGVTNRTGTRHGPREVRNQSSMMRSVNQSTGIDPFAMCQVADIGDALPDSPFELEQSHRSIQAFFDNVVEQGVVPVSAGGDHSITLPILRALGVYGSNY